MKNWLFCLFPAVLLLAGCGGSDPGPAPVPENYEEMVEEWKENRIETLKEPTGWLRLAGMFWLEEGVNTFGSGDDMDIQFPEGTIPEYAGMFVYEDGMVTMRVADGVGITHDGDPVDEMVLDNGDETPAAEYNFLEWLVITRGEIKAIRLYNKENVQADAFDGFPAYPVDPEWRRAARYIPNPEGSAISIANVLGQQEDAPSPGTIEFTIGDTRHTLAALEGSGRMFIIVGDETNRTKTYQAGRYIYIDYPEEGSEFTVIDFNKLYNPPCAFNLYTTCQLPPLQNRLDVAVTAGELRPVDWVGLESATK